MACLTFLLKYVTRIVIYLSIYNTSIWDILHAFLSLSNLAIASYQVSHSNSALNNYIF